jgi:hypothetical protein
MGRIRGWVKRLERASREEMIEIPQRDGTTARFPASEGMSAFMNFIGRLQVHEGEEIPPEHPLITAARNSPDPTWSRSFFATTVPEEPIEDLSEP